jgi:hypothetical protein
VNKGGFPPEEEEEDGRTKVGFLLKKKKKKKKGGFPLHHRGLLSPRPQRPKPGVRVIDFLGFFPLTVA